MKRELLTDAHLDQEVTVALRVRDLMRLAANDPTVSSADVPRGMPSVPVGADYEGGKFAGITLDGEQLAALVLLPGDFQGTWAEAKDWAGKEDGVLPSRHDQLVLFKNLKSEFKDTYYWSGEQHADAAGCAWCQGFSGGTQYWDDVSDRGRARAVRRIPIR